MRPKGVEVDNESWVQTLGAWADDMSHLAGNRVNLVDIELADLRPKLRISSRLWTAILTDGVLLAGSAPVELVSGD